MVFNIVYHSLIRKNRWSYSSYFYYFRLCVMSWLVGLHLKNNVSDIFPPSYRYASNYGQCQTPDIHGFY